MRNDDEPRRGPGVKESNRLLAALSTDEDSKLEPHLEHVELHFRDLLQEMDGRIEHVLFPHTGVISAVKEFGNGDVIEVATMGTKVWSGTQWR